MKREKRGTVGAVKSRRVKPVEREWVLTYDTASAIRGSDVLAQSAEESAHLHRLKHNVTARLRGIFFKPAECPGIYVRYEMTSRMLTSVRQSVKFLAGKEGRHAHYLFHLRMGVQATVKHPVWGGHGDGLIEALNV